MTVTLAGLWRYPIKGIGAEALLDTHLTHGRPVPMDRAWAVLEEGGEPQSGWRASRNFLRGAKGASLMAIMARSGENVVHLSHPDRPDLTVALREGPAPDLFEWLKPIYPENRQPPSSLVAAPPEGMADVPFASISVLNLSSLRALSQRADRTLDPRRFRGNLWLEGLAPWEEFDLVGKFLRIGDAELQVIEPITRCRATEANPETGRRDTPTLQILEAGWGHTDFGVYAKVTRGGAIHDGATVEIQP